MACETGDSKYLVFRIRGIDEPSSSARVVLYIPKLNGSSVSWMSEREGELGRLARDFAGSGYRVNPLKDIETLLGQPEIHPGDDVPSNRAPEWYKRNCLHSDSLVCTGLTDSEITSFRREYNNVLQRAA